MDMTVHTLSLQPVTGGQQHLTTPLRDRVEEAHVRAQPNAVADEHGLEHPHLVETVVQRTRAVLWRQASVLEEVRQQRQHVKAVHERASMGTAAGYLPARSARGCASE